MLKRTCTILAVMFAVTSASTTFAAEQPLKKEIGQQQMEQSKDKTERKNKHRENEGERKKDNRNIKDVSYSEQKYDKQNIENEHKSASTQDVQQIEPKQSASAEKINLPIPRIDEQTPDYLPEYLVGGVIKDVTQKILPVSIEARYYAPHLDVKVKSDSIRYNDGSVGFKDDLGFDNDKAPEFILRYKRTSLDYIHVHGTGNRTLGRNERLRFNGTTYSGRVHSQSDLHYLKLNFSSPIINVIGSGIDLNYGLTGMYWKGSIKGTENATSTTIKKSKEYGVPIPTIGIGAHAALLPSLNVYANFSGLPLGGYGHFYDFEAGIRYNPIELLGISIGFRRIDLNVSHDDDSGKLKLNGPYAGLRFDF